MGLCALGVAGALALAPLAGLLAQRASAASPGGTVVAWGVRSGENWRTWHPYVPAGLSGVIAISAGGRQHLALKGDGTVVAWGDYASTQVYVPEDLSGVTAISAGGLHSLALKSDGTVVAFEVSDQYGLNNTYGETDVPAGLSGVTAISAGYRFSLALKSDGTVVAWGYDDKGQAHVPPGLTGVTAISAGGAHSLALKSDGTVVAWGGDSEGQAHVPPGLTGVTAISAGGAHSLALKSDGTVVAWGGDSVCQEKDVPTGLTGVTAISAGGSGSLALKGDGTIVAWGRCISPAPAGLTGATAISAGRVSLALGTMQDQSPWRFLIPAIIAIVVALALAVALALVAVIVYRRKAGKPPLQLRKAGVLKAMATVALIGAALAVVAFVVFLLISRPLMCNQQEITPGTVCINVATGREDYGPLAGKIVEVIIACVVLVAGARGLIKALRWLWAR